MNRPSTSPTPARKAALSLLTTAAMLAVGACATPFATRPEPGKPPAARSEAGNKPPATASAPTQKPPAADPLAPRRRMDALEPILIGRLRDADVETARISPDQVRVRISGSAVFAADETRPNPQLTRLLDRLARILAEQPGTQATVETHTDALGRELYNMELSVARADAIVAYLFQRGIPHARLASRPRGETQPIADNGDEAGRARNRRIEILIRPL